MDNGHLKYEVQYGNQYRDLELIDGVAAFLLAMLCCASLRSFDVSFSALTDVFSMAPRSRAAINNIIRPYISKVTPHSQNKRNCDIQIS